MDNAPALTKKTPAKARHLRRTHAERKTETADRLLDAAWELFVEAGYEAASLNAIAKRAGYTRTPIHQMFGDKAGLFAAVWRAQLRQLAPQQLQAIGDATSVPELLRLLVMRNMSLQDDPTMRALRKLINTVRLLSDDDDGAVLEHFIVLELEDIDHFAALLDNLSRSGPPLVDEPRLVAQRIGNYLGGLQELAHPRINPIDPDEAMVAMLTLAYGTLPHGLGHDAH